MAKQVWKDKNEDGTVTVKDFTLAQSEVGGPDKVAEKSVMSVAGVIILVAIICALAVNAIYSQKKKKE